MPKLPLSNARPGQRLVRPVITANGVVMVRPGTELTATLIERLRSLGIDTVTVASSESIPGRGSSLDQRLRELDARFAGHEHDAVMMQIKDVVARQLRRPPARGDA